MKQLRGELDSLERAVNLQTFNAESANFSNFQFAVDVLAVASNESHGTHLEQSKWTTSKYENTTTKLAQVTSMFLPFLRDTGGWGRCTPLGPRRAPHADLLKPESKSKQKTSPQEP